MTNYQEQLKQAQAEFKEAMLTFCAAEAELNLAAWTYYEAEEILKTKHWHSGGRTRTLSDQSALSTRVA